MRGIVIDPGLAPIIVSMIPSDSQQLESWMGGPFRLKPFGHVFAALVNALAEITRKVAKPGALCDVAITVSAEYSYRVFSEDLTSVSFDENGGMHQ